MLIILLSFLLCVILALIIISVLYSQLRQINTTIKTTTEFMPSTTSFNFPVRTIPFASNEINIPPEKPFILTTLMPMPMPIVHGRNGE